MAKTTTIARPNFSSILDIDDEDVQRPAQAPIGTFLFTVRGLPRADFSSKKGTEFREYTLVAMQAMDDVDEESLDEFLTMPSGEKRKLSEAPFPKATFYLTDNSLFMLKDFLDACGVESGGKLRDRIDKANGCQVLGKIKHTPRQSGDGIRAEFANFMPAE